MPLDFDPRDLTVTEYPLWRRVNYAITTRLKHWVGVHTYVETLYPAFDDNNMLTALNVRNECWVCGRLK